MKNIWRAIQFIPEYRGRVVGVLAVGTVLGAIGVAGPQLYKHVVDIIAGLLSGTSTQAEATHDIIVAIVAFLVLRVSVVAFTALQDKQADDLWLDTVSTFRQRVSRT